MPNFCQLIHFDWFVVFRLKNAAFQLVFGHLAFTPFIGAIIFSPHFFHDRLLYAPGDLPIEVDELQPEGP